MKLEVHKAASSPPVAHWHGSRSSGVSPCCMRCLRFQLASLASSSLLNPSIFRQDLLLPVLLDLLLQEQFEAVGGVGHQHQVDEAGARGPAPQIHGLAQSLRAGRTRRLRPRRCTGFEWTSQAMLQDLSRRSSRREWRPVTPRRESSETERTRAPGPPTHRRQRGRRRTPAGPTRSQRRV